MLSSYLYVAGWAFDQLICVQVSEMSDVNDIIVTEGPPPVREYLFLGDDLSFSHPNP
jgi:hypothetical protein